MCQSVNLVGILHLFHNYFLLPGAVLQSKNLVIPLMEEVLESLVFDVIVSFVFGDDLVFVREFGISLLQNRR